MDRSHCQRHTRIRVLHLLAVPAVVILLSSWASGQIYGGPGGRGETQMDQQVQQAAQAVEKLTTTVFQEYLLQARTLESNDIAAIRTLLSQSDRYTGRFSKEYRAYHSMLQAMLAYYGGEGEQAMRHARQAYSDSPENYDTGDLLITLAMCYGEYPAAREVLESRQAGQAIIGEMPAPELAQAAPSSRSNEPNVPSRGGASRGEPNVPSRQQPEPTTTEPSRWERLLGGPGSQQPEPGRRPAQPEPRQSEVVEIVAPPRGSMQMHLALPTDYMLAEQLGRSFENVTFAGLNGSFFHFAPGNGQILCLFLWNSQPAREIRKTYGTLPGAGGFGGGMGPMGGGMMMPPMGGMFGGPSGISRRDLEAVMPVATDLPTNGEQFAQFFLKYVLGRKIWFAGLNFDPPTPEQQMVVLDQSAQQAWPWTTCMAALPANSDGWDFGAIRSCAMMIVDTDGKVAYVGPVGGYLPRMLLDRQLAQATGADLSVPAAPQMQASQPAGAQTPAIPAAPAIEDRPRPEPMPEPSQPQAPATPTYTEGERMQAQNMISAAQVQRRVTPMSALNMCDEVIQRWPGSPEADQAKLIIRGLMREGRNQDLLKLRQQQGKYTGTEE